MMIVEAVTRPSRNPTRTYVRVIFLFLSLTGLHAVPESRLRLRWPIPVAASGKYALHHVEDKNKETKRLEEEIYT
jgi:hypothetical protein